jgi:hypothetical protein
LSFLQWLSHPSADKLETRATMKIVNQMPAPGEKLDDETREKIRRMQEDLKALEMPRDVEPFGERRAAYFRWVNEIREEDGRAPLVNDEENDPELTRQRESRFQRYLATGH